MADEPPEEQGLPPQPVLFAVYAALFVTLIVVLILVGVYGT